MKKFALTLFCITIVLNLLAQCRLDKTEWKILFQEEFNGSKLDLSTNWYFGEFWGSTLYRTIPTCTGSEIYGCNSPDQVEITNGLGIFSVEKKPALFTCDDKISSHEFSGICAKYDEFPTESPPGFPDRNGFIFGMFEIRCKLTKRGATYPNFWLSGNSWPPEIDVFEYHGGDKKFFSTVHWGTTTGKYSCSNFFEGTSIDISDDFHTWTMVWTPNTITMFLDGVEYYSFNDVSKIPASSGFGDMWAKMHLMLGNGYFCGAPGTDWGWYDDFIVDYVRVYKPIHYRNFDPLVDTRASFFADQVFLYNTTNFKSNADWVHNIIKPDLFYPNDNVHSGLIGLQGGGKFKYRGNFDLLWYTYWDAGRFYNFPVDWIHKVDDNIFLAEKSGTEITFFRNGLNIYYEDGAFTLIPTVSDASSDIVSNSTGDFLYYRNTSGRLKYISRLGTGIWSSPTSISWAPLIGSVIPNTVIYDDNFDRVFYITNTNKIVECNNALGVISLPGGVTDAASNLVLAPSGDHLFYVSTSGIVKSIQKVGGAWSSSSDFIIYNGTVPTTLSGVKNRSLLISPDYSNLQLYFVDFADSPRCVYFDGSVYRVSPSLISNATVKSDFKLIKLGVSPSTKTVISFIGVDDLIHTLSWESPCSRDAACKDQKTLFRKAGDNIVENQNTPQKLIVSPNPTKNVFSISPCLGINEITIFSLDGKIVFSKKYYPPTSDKLSVNIQNLVSGIYICRITTENSSHVFKILKND